MSPGTVLISWFRGTALLSWPLKAVVAMARRWKYRGSVPIDKTTVALGYRFSRTCDTDFAGLLAFDPFSSVVCPRFAEIGRAR